MTMRELENAKHYFCYLTGARTPHQVQRVRLAVSWCALRAALESTARNSPGKEGRHEQDGHRVRATEVSHLWNETHS